MSVERASAHHEPNEEATPVNRPSRPRELQDMANLYFYHPLAWWLARRIARTPITPNMVSIAGGFSVAAAAIAYTSLAWPLSAMIGLLLHMTWHVLDGADGDVARLTGRSGPIGEVIDGVCDYAGHIILYFSLGLVLHHAIGAIGWAAPIAAGVSRIVQANHFEVERRQYLWWLYGVPWLDSAQRDAFGGRGGLHALGAAYLSLARLVAPRSERIDAAIIAAADDPAQLKRICSIVRMHSVGPLAGLHMLSANHRTLALGLSMFVGSPIYYFLYESLILNIVLLRSISRYRRVMVRIDRLLDQADASVLR